MCSEKLGSVTLFRRFVRRRRCWSWVRNYRWWRRVCLNGTIIGVVNNTCSQSSYEQICCIMNTTYLCYRTGLSSNLSSLSIRWYTRLALFSVTFGRISSSCTSLPIRFTSCVDNPSASCWLRWIPHYVIRVSFASINLRVLLSQFGMSVLQVKNIVKISAVDVRLSSKDLEGLSTERSSNTSCSRDEYKTTRRFLIRVQSGSCESLSSGPHSNGRMTSF